MTNKTLTGLEAVLLMQEGGYITDGQHIYRFVNTKIEASDIVSFNKGKPEWKSGNVFNFNYDQYEEYTEPKPSAGWELVDENCVYYFINDKNVSKYYAETWSVDNNRYDNANYFSTKEKAEEINFKQTLFRKLQRFSDENGKVDWENAKNKYFITFSTLTGKMDVQAVITYKIVGSVYFISEEVARQAIDLFHDDLIKYFTM